MMNNNSSLNTRSLLIKHPNYPRIGQKVIKVDEYAYIFGGTVHDGSLNKTVFKFDFEKLKI